MSTLAHDLRLAFRALRRTPGFAIAAVGALALGIGATSTIFTVVNGVLLRPLQYEAPDRLANIWNDLGEGAQSLPAVSPLDFRDYQRRSRAFEDFAAAAEGNVANLRGNLTGDGEPAPATEPDLLHRLRPAGAGRDVRAGPGGDGPDRPPVPVGVQGARGLEAPHPRRAAPARAPPRIHPAERPAHRSEWRSRQPAVTRTRAPVPPGMDGEHRRNV